MNKNFIAFNNNGKITHTGSCPVNSFYLQAKEGETVIEGIANQKTQKIDTKTKKIIDKTPEEIEASKPPKRKSVPEKDRPAYITKGQLQNILDRLSALDSKSE